MKRRVLAVLAAMALGMGMLAAGAVSPATAASSSSPVAKYVALGDSIGAGQGGGAPLDTCARTGGGYAAQLDMAPKFNLLRNAACTGATIGDVRAQLSQLNRGTTVVTLTVGANDLGLDQVYAACSAALVTQDPTGCLAAAGAAAAAAGSLTEPLTMLIGDIAQRAPNATIVVTGYPLLLEAMPPLEVCSPILGYPTCAAMTALVTAVNGAAVALNGAIAAAAGTSYVDVTGAFAGHGVNLMALPGGTGQEWFGIDPADPAGFLHPNYAGYSGYTQVILSALGR